MRASHLQRFYDIIDDLRQRNSARLLRDCHGRMSWPRRGVYFFFEDGEVRDDDISPRVVRVGTHAVSVRAKTTLWNRLRQHKGTRVGGGNHRSSIFRLLVGAAILNRDDEIKPKPTTWSVGSSAPRHGRDDEQPLERLVSEYIGAMPFLWVKADDEPGPKSIRSFIERNSIALVSRCNRIGEVADSPSPSWRGRYCPQKAVRESGLWNIRHTGEDYDPSFLDLLDRCVASNHDA